MHNVYTKNMNTVHLNTAFHIKKMYNVNTFIISWLIIHTSWKQDRETLIEQSLTVIQQSRNFDML